VISAQVDTKYTVFQWKKTSKMANIAALFDKYCHPLKMRVFWPNKMIFIPNCVLKSATFSFGFKKSGVFSRMHQ